MKKLSLLISIIVLASMFISCSNKKNKAKSENQSVVEKPLIVKIDTIKYKQDTLNINTKDSNKGNNVINEAPKHKSPDQAEIDSIKKAKEKLKK